MEQQLKAVLLKRGEANLLTRMVSIQKFNHQEAHDIATELKNTVAYAMKDRHADQIVVMISHPEAEVFAEIAKRVKFPHYSETAIAVALTAKVYKAFGWAANPPPSVDL